MEGNNNSKAPLLGDCGGPIYDPRKALRLFEELAGGNTELIRDERLVNTMRRALVAQYPLEPKFQKGKRGKLYDSYLCRNCGFGVKEVVYDHCPSCGQKLTDCFAGKRKTQEEEEKYWD